MSNLGPLVPFKLLGELAINKKYILILLDISLPKISRRETKVPLKYRMDGDYSADGKVYTSFNNASSTIKQDEGTSMKYQGRVSENR